MGYLPQAILLLFPLLIGIVRCRERGEHRDLLGQLLPGPVWGGRLFLLDVQTSGTYDNEEDVFVDVFAMAKEVFTVPQHGNFRCQERSDAAAAFNLTAELKDTLLSREEVSYLPLFCLVHGSGARQERAPLERIPLRSHDGNQDDSTLIWRCDISKFVSRSKWRSHPKKEGLRLRVSIMTSGWDVITTVDIPVNRGGAVGLYRTPSAVAPLPADASITLCTGGIRREHFHYLREFVAHHLLVGVGHIVLGLYAQPGDLITEEVRRLLAPWVLDGKVALVHTAVPFVSCFGDMIETLHFYHSCLYKAKGTSEFVAMWGVEDFWLPSPDDLAPDAMARTLRSISAGTCGKEWCYATFPALHVHKGNAGARQRSRRRYGAEYTLREKQPDNTWKRAVSRTKSAGMGGLHVHGSCKRLKATGGMRYSVDGGNRACNADLVGCGAIHKFRTDVGETLSGSAYTQDEYAAFYYPRVDEALQRLPAG